MPYLVSYTGNDFSDNPETTFLLNLTSGMRNELDVQTLIFTFSDSNKMTLLFVDELAAGICNKCVM